MVASALPVSFEDESLAGARGAQVQQRGNPSTGARVGCRHPYAQEPASGCSFPTSES